LYQSVLRAIAALKKGSASSIVKFITKSDVENIKLLIPHDDAMLNSFNKVFSFAEHIKKENAELSSLRDFLLPLLMNGQVTFKEADCH
jgi:type I restriction enzyme S subunit